YFNNDNTKGLPADIIAKSANFAELTRGYPNLEVPGYTAEELQAMNSAIANYRTYNLQTKKLQPGYKLALDAGQSFKTSGGLKYGFAGTIYKSATADVEDSTRYNTDFNVDTNEVTSGEKTDIWHTKIRDKVGGLISFKIDNQKGHKLKYTYLNINDKENTTVFSHKDGGASGPGRDDEERTYYEYIQKTIYAHQLSGEHEVKFSFIESDYFNNVQFNWALEKAGATRYLPGSVEYFYEKTSDVTDFTLDKKIWYVYSDLNDELDNYRLDIKLPYKFNGRNNDTSFGYFYYHKSRSLDNRRFKTEHKLGTDVFVDIDSVFTQETVDNEDLVLSSNYRSDDAYTAKQDVTAFYVKQLLSVRKDLDILGSVRQENSKQLLINSSTGEPYDPLTTDDLLTSISANYSLNDENKFRLGFANTLTRPDFRDFSPNRSKDPETEDLFFGNPDLTYTTINNFDFKYEWYLSYDEIVSFGLFLKDFTNPIETIYIPDPDSQSGKKIATPRNALGATSKGLEFSFRKKLGFINKSLENYFVASNLAIIDSKIKLDRKSSDEIVARLTTTNRAMQDQSPYVINFNIGYDNINTGRSVVLLYNEFGKRITGLGVDYAPDYYEYPFKKLDFVVKWRLNDTYDEQVKKIGYNVDFKITNILDSTKETRQGDALLKSKKPGRVFTLSFSMKY
ncbi:MAG: hypothetical protein R3240_08850, partial [Gammaproteobacteria bacterium]|nr:hypothetical protein [Gammaproteobacteria bacterium]